MATDPQPANQRGLEKLKQILERELAAPGSAADALESLGEALPDLEPVTRFLKLKDEQHRHAFYVKSQHFWFRRLGWRLMRPLFVLAVVSAVGMALLWKGDPTVPLALFLAGAASFYVLLQVFIHRWAFRDLKKLGELNARYLQRIEELLAELKGEGKAPAAPSP
jgi:hypothetical protein